MDVDSIIVSGGTFDTDVFRALDAAARETYPGSAVAPSLLEAAPAPAHEDSAASRCTGSIPLDHRRGAEPVEPLSKRKSYRCGLGVTNSNVIR